MKIDDLIESLRTARRCFKHDNDFYRPDDKKFETEVVFFLKKLYEEDENAKWLIDENYLEELIDFLEDNKKELDSRYYEALRVITDDIDRKDYTKIAKRFNEADKKFKNITLEQYIAPYVIETQTPTCFIHEYTNWKNLLNDYYEDIQKGDFSKLIMFSKWYDIIPYIKHSIGLVIDMYLAQGKEIPGNKSCGKRV